MNKLRIIIIIFLIMYNFLVNAAVVAETEPNSTTANANVLTSIDSGSGSLSPIGDIDYWKVEGATVGHEIFITVHVEEAGITKDTLLNVYASDGTTLIEFDEDGGDELGSAVVATIPTSGDLYFRINEYQNNEEISPYYIFQTVQNPVNNTAETEPNDTPSTASPASININSGNIDLAEGKGEDYFKFDGVAGERMAVILDQGAKDIDIQVFSTDGVSLLGREINGSQSQRSEVFIITDTGTNFLRLTCDTVDCDYHFVIVGSSGGTVPIELQSFSID